MDIRDLTLREVTYECLIRHIPSEKRYPNAILKDLSHAIKTDKDAGKDPHTIPLPKNTVLDSEFEQINDSINQISGLAKSHITRSVLKQIKSRLYHVELRLSRIPKSKVTDKTTYEQTEENLASLREFVSKIKISTENLKGNRSKTFVKSDHNPTNPTMFRTPPNNPTNPSDRDSATNQTLQPSTTSTTQSIDTYPTTSAPTEIPKTTNLGAIKKTIQPQTSQLNPETPVQKDTNIIDLQSSGFQSSYYPPQPTQLQTQFPQLQYAPPPYPQPQYLQPQPPIENGDKINQKIENMEKKFADLESSQSRILQLLEKLDSRSNGSAVANSQNRISQIQTSPENDEETEFNTPNPYNNPIKQPNPQNQLFPPQNIHNSTGINYQPQPQNFQNFQNYNQQNFNPQVYYQQPQFNEAFLYAQHNLFKSISPVAHWKLIFSGDSKSQLTVEEFIDKAELYAATDNLEIDRLAQLGVYLFTGDALRIYRSNKYRISSWEELKSIIRETFEPGDYQSNLRQKLAETRQGAEESFMSYYARVMDIFRAYKPPPSHSTKLYWLKRNLHSRIGKCIMNETLDTVDQFEKCCRKVERNLREISVINFKWKNHNSNNRYEKHQTALQINVPDTQNDNFENDNESVYDSHESITDENLDHDTRPESVNEISNQNKFPNNPRNANDRNTFNAKRDGNSNSQFRSDNKKRNLYCYICLIENDHHTANCPKNPNKEANTKAYNKTNKSDPKSDFKNNNNGQNFQKRQESLSKS